MLDLNSAHQLCACGKRMLPDRDAAEEALYSARRRAGGTRKRGRKVEKRYYRCGLCGTFHLTSHPRS